MASKLIKAMPLWKRKLPKYPLYYKGDPQNRLLLPMFWMKVIKPEHKIPLDHVHFKVHPEMSKADIKQYLEKIYGVPVLNVRIELRPGKDIMNEFDMRIWKEDEEKHAYVQLKSDTFQFPLDVSKFDHFESREKAIETVEESEKKYHQKEIYAGLPPWFQ